MDALKEMLFPILMLLTAALTVTFAEGLQKLFLLIERLPAWAKRVLVGTIAVVLTKAYALIGVVDVPTDILGMSGEDVAAVVSAILAFLFHKADKVKERNP